MRLKRLVNAQKPKAKLLSRPVKFRIDQCCFFEQSWCIGNLPDMRQYFYNFYKCANQLDSQFVFEVERLSEPLRNGDFFWLD